MRWLVLMLALLGAAACPPAPPPADGGQPESGPCLDRPGASNAPSDQLPCELYPPKN